MAHRHMNPPPPPPTHTHTNNLTTALYTKGCVGIDTGGKHINLTLNLFMKISNCVTKISSEMQLFPTKVDILCKVWNSIL